MASSRVLVGMSGGVDSSVAAALLLEEGFDVVGVTLRFWGERNRCCSVEDLADAQKVAARLGIPHYVIHMEEAFKREVVDYFVAEYRRGRTPNPCALCNPKIKFGELFRKARELGAETLATGHYAAITPPESSHGRYGLRRGLEHDKDQSYFLARLSQEQLAHARFPIGGQAKEAIRQKAKRLGLEVATKKDSQEACFIPDGDVAGFIQTQLEGTFPEGEIVDRHGHVLGKHKGIIGYTIGQRKGLGIALGRPQYVIGIDPEDNLVIVGEDEDLMKRRFIATAAHWIGIENLAAPRDAEIRIRYKHSPARGRIYPYKEGQVEVQFEEAQRAITPGQLAVFYQDDAVLGSAWIDHVLD